MAAKQKQDIQNGIRKKNPQLPKRLLFTIDFHGKLPSLLLHVSQCLSELKVSRLPRRESASPSGAPDAFSGWLLGRFAPFQSCPTTDENYQKAQGIPSPNNAHSQ